LAEIERENGRVTTHNQKRSPQGSPAELEVEELKRPLQKGAGPGMPFIFRGSASDLPCRRLDRNELQSAEKKTVKVEILPRMGFWRKCRKRRGKNSTSTDAENVKVKVDILLRGSGHSKDGGGWDILKKKNALSKREQVVADSGKIG